MFIEDDTDARGNRESPHSRHAEALRIEDSSLGYRVTGAKAVPLTFAERLFQEGSDLGGQVLYGLWSLGYGGQVMTSTEIVKVLTSIPDGMSKRTVYRGLSDMDDIFISVLSEYTPVDSILIPISDESHTMYRGYNLAQQYKIPEIPDTIAPLPIWACRSGRAFRLAMILDLIANHPRQYSHKYLATRIGLKIGTLKNYLRTLRTTGMIESVERLTVTPLNLQNLYSVMKSIEADETVKKNKKGEYRGIFLQDENDVPYPLNHGLAAKLLYEGRQLTLVRQRPNFYQVKRDENS